VESDVPVGSSRRRPRERAPGTCPQSLGQPSDETTARRLPTLPTVRRRGPPPCVGSGPFGAAGPFGLLRPGRGAALKGRGSAGPRARRGGLRLDEPHPPCGPSPGLRPAPRWDFAPRCPAAPWFSGRGGQAGPKGSLPLLSCPPALPPFAVALRPHPSLADPSPSGLHPVPVLPLRSPPPAPRLRTRPPRRGPGPSARLDSSVSRQGRGWPPAPARGSLFA